MLTADLAGLAIVIKILSGATLLMLLLTFTASVKNGPKWALRVQKASVVIVIMGLWALLLEFIKFHAFEPVDVTQVTLQIACLMAILLIEKRRSANDVKFSEFMRERLLDTLGDKSTLTLLFIALI